MVAIYTSSMERISSLFSMTIGCESIIKDDINRLSYCEKVNIINMNRTLILICILNDNETQYAIQLESNRIILMDTIKQSKLSLFLYDLTQISYIVMYLSIYLLVNSTNGGYTFTLD